MTLSMRSIIGGEKSTLANIIKKNGRYLKTIIEKQVRLRDRRPINIIRQDGSVT